MEQITQVRLSSSATDEHGLPITTETLIPIEAIVGLRSSLSNSQFDADAITVTQGLTLYLASGADVQDGDKFIVRGKRYAIDGESFDWRDGLGNWNPGTVVNLVREQNGL
jgi:hypothetical protein